jgi:hypothetical protein
MFKLTDFPTMGGSPSAAVVSQIEDAVRWQAITPPYDRSFRAKILNAISSNQARP